GLGPRRSDSQRCLRWKRRQQHHHRNHHSAAALAPARRWPPADRVQRSSDLVDAAGALIAQVWAVRHGVETGASLRFAALAQGMHGAGAPATLVDLARRASTDEIRHAGHCADILRSRGADVPPPETRLLFFGPRDLGPEQRLTSEVAAQSCTSETESMATLVTLLDAASDAHLQTVLQELARDEVQHARLGWAYLAWAKDRLDLSFLSKFLPAMAAAATGEDLFQPSAPGAEVPALLSGGVVPKNERRRIYLETLDSVVIPGFEEFGIDTGPLRQWAEDRRRVVVGLDPSGSS